MRETIFCVPLLFSRKETFFHALFIKIFTRILDFLLAVSNIFECTGIFFSRAQKIEFNRRTSFSQTDYLYITFFVSLQKWLYIVIWEEGGPPSNITMVGYSKGHQNMPVFIDFVIAAYYVNIRQFFWIIKMSNLV